MLMHHFFAKNHRQELVVGNVLDHGDDNVSGLLEQSLVIPVRVDGGQLPCDLVVLPHPQRVDGH